ncbi:BREX-1 system adenine-specific DNA-methyltransferase PglX [Mangrovibacterium marinum]|uniref:site-specific DNA-methyltransferase (adenine-specific) n=1 Tax=Mangrovibacterium marinum TaxID=1639118 RepID=A0A2T5BVA6_9BACT|nr:BREX-1 system adenine-specific DNA-methyltransferase PglX [Mangrovibacterium marinum]PTN03470.1 N-6 DNA methylase [Mangrovibacterium marinum]
MNTNKLKKFAQEARRKLMEQVGARLALVLSTDSAALREKAEQLRKLQEAINSSSKAQVIDKVAYTWFNRLMALRFMDANDYQPIGLRVVTPKDGYTLPELLDEAKQGHIPDDLPVKKQHIYDLLDGKIPSTNPQNEAYKELLIGACNHLNKVFPFLFERIEDYTELLLPDDLISEFSFVQDMRDGMTTEDCQQVEIIGWLYQFYISELNEDLISSKKKYEKNELAPASQLFTPKWVVQYMVDNTLGQLWSEINPTTKILASLEFYIKPAYKDQLEPRKPKNIEEIKFFEPCVGSGHILSYAFDVFYKMYEEQGYNPTEIPELIITKNLFGVDIDQRAAQLAAFVLLMKGREKHRRFLRNVERSSIQPNIAYYQDFATDSKFSNASALGSLIRIEQNEMNSVQVDESSLFGGQQKELKRLYQLLGQRYDVVVTNPPYISSSRMEGSLKQYVEATYPDTKSDLFSTFVLRCLELCDEGGLTGYMTPFVWMFISSYEKLREIMIDQHFINNLIQLEYSGFDGATVPICTFTLRNKNLPNAKGSYIRLSDFKGAANQAPKTLEAIRNPQSNWFYTAYQKDFQRLPDCRLGYWLNETQITSIENDNSLEVLGNTRRGLQSGSSERFIRIWHETEINNFVFPSLSALNDTQYKKWVVLNSGGSFRRWYGNLNTVVNWYRRGEEIKSTGKAIIPSEHLYFQRAIVWNKIISGTLGFRIQEHGIIPGDASPAFFLNKGDNLTFILGFLNSKVINPLLALFAPTLNAQVGDVKKIPIKDSDSSEIEDLVNSSIDISTQEWSIWETSWNFQKNELTRINAQDIEESYDLYEQYWKNKFFQLHQNEEELNRQFIEIYGLQDELTPDVPLEDITILKEETSIKNGQLVFHADEVFAQFVSYAVGCLFGRYSLDKEGLILANQGETLEDYLQKIQNSNSKFQTINDLSFVPDDDNIIPVLDDEWFEDDIVGRFYEFLKVSFGKENFDKNLAFVEDCLGKDIRKYFMKDFYTDHIRRYKKRPIYWMFSSPKGSFNVLIYMHRYTPDTLNKILNGYLREYKEKLQTHQEHLDHLMVTGSSTEQARASKQKDKLKLVLLELQEYERDVLYPLATERIAIDLDDGVLVNYNKFGKAIKPVPGLNDKKTKDKVRKFDWIDVEEIR